MEEAFLSLSNNASPQRGQKAHKLRTFHPRNGDGPSSSRIEAI